MTRHRIAPAVWLGQDVCSAATRWRPSASRWARAVGAAWLTAACTPGTSGAGALPIDDSGQAPAAQAAMADATSGASSTPAATPATNSPAADAAAPAGAGAQPAGTPTKPVPDEGLKSRTEVNGYVIVGRPNLSTPSAPRLGFPSSAIGATFTGTQVSVTMSSTGHDFWQAVIDGGMPTVLEVTQAEALIPVATGLSQGTHTIWLTKRTESWHFATDTDYTGITTFKGFTLDADGRLGDLPATRARRMTFVGASEYTGLGIEGPNGSCMWSPATENAILAVPGRVAAKLNAEHHNCAWSGQGVAFSALDGDPSHLLTIGYTEVGPPNLLPTWDRKNFVSDVVVLSAGGLDLCGNPGSGRLMVADPAATDWCGGDRSKNYRADASGFVAAYVAWLKVIRADAPNAVIVVVLPSGATLGDRTELGQALQLAVKTFADPMTYYFDYYDVPPTYTSYADAANQLKLGWGCNNHPSILGSDFLAERLANFISDKRGWPRS